MSGGSWEHFHHQADIGVRGIGDSLEEAFAQGALALSAVVCNVKRIAEADEVEVACRAADVEVLFVDWLGAVIYEMAMCEMVFGRFEVHIDGEKLVGKCWGERVDPERHETAVEVKGATYSQLKVEVEDGKYVAQCVVDV